jgi:hypothetical protein
MKQTFRYQILIKTWYDKSINQNFSIPLENVQLEQIIFESDVGTLK